MAFDQWIGKSWTVVTHVGAPKFFEPGRIIRFKDLGKDKSVESTEAAISESKVGSYDEVADELTVVFADPPRKCFISRFEHSNDSNRQALICRIVEDGGGLGEAGSWTALDGSGDDGLYA